MPFKSGLLDVVNKAVFNADQSRHKDAVATAKAEFDAAHLKYQRALDAEKTFKAEVDGLARDLGVAASAPATSTIPVSIQIPAVPPIAEAPADRAKNSRSPRSCTNDEQCGVGQACIFATEFARENDEPGVCRRAR